MKKLFNFVIKWHICLDTFVGDYYTQISAIIEHNRKNIVNLKLGGKSKQIGGDKLADDHAENDGDGVAVGDGDFNDDDAGDGWP